MFFNFKLNNDKLFNCDKCNKQMKTMGALKTHNLHFHPDYRCFTCGRGFRTSQDLAAHESVHTGI